MEVKSLESVIEESSKTYKSINVTKEIDLQLDLGNLLAVDINTLPLKTFRKDKDVFLQELARDNVQILLNKIWEIPATRREDAVVIELPKGTTGLPREKPIPKPKAPTRWEEYAKAKGIQKKTKSHLVYDEQHKEFRPRFGYKRANDEAKDWVMEVGAAGDPNIDPFAKKSEEKKERVAKNEFQRLKNIAKSSKFAGVLPAEADQHQQSKQQLSKAIANARVATASVGNFVEDIAKEKPHMKRLGKKRKFEPTVSDFDKEKKKNLDILEKVKNKTPKINAEKAAGKEMDNVNRENAKNKAGKKEKSKSKGKGSVSASKKGKNRKGASHKQKGRKKLKFQ